MAVVGIRQRASGKYFRNGSEIKAQIETHLLTLYSLFFDLNSCAIRAKKQKI